MKMKRDIGWDALVGVRNNMRRKKEKVFYDKSVVFSGDWSADIANGTISCNFYKGVGIKVKLGDDEIKLVYRLIEAGQGNWVDMATLGVEIGVIKTVEDTKVRNWGKKKITDSINRVRRGITKRLVDLGINIKADVTRWIENDRTNGYRLNKIEWDKPIGF